MKSRAGDLHATSFRAEQYASELTILRTKLPAVRIVLPAKGRWAQHQFKE